MRFEMKSSCAPPAVAHPTSSSYQIEVSAILVPKKDGTYINRLVGHLPKGGKIGRQCGVEDAPVDFGTHSFWTEPGFDLLHSAVEDRQGYVPLWLNTREESRGEQWMGEVYATRQRECGSGAGAAAVYTTARNEWGKSQDHGNERMRVPSLRFRVPISGAKFPTQSSSQMLRSVGGVMLIRGREELGSGKALRARLRTPHTVDASCGWQYPSCSSSLSVRADTRQGRQEAREARRVSFHNFQWSIFLAPIGAAVSVDQASKAAGCGVARGSGRRAGDENDGGRSEMAVPGHSSGFARDGLPANLNVVCVAIFSRTGEFEAHLTPSPRALGILSGKKATGVSRDHEVVDDEVVVFAGVMVCFSKKGPAITFKGGTPANIVHRRFVKLVVPPMVLLYI
ncbi:hypothetical protein C8F04DRAFT_1318412 [Mycena alexandri]|uniref:Uncharacterized protein n=1 Tax=Mycena alexandri TaxID=1745969 RepID=A0AAD6WQW3_9AGAR|nr:hypothetical protein C8F04DRAFT_1318412 [Mycena alexandri]